MGTLLFAESPSEVDLPDIREDLDKGFPQKQEIIGQGKDRKEIAQQQLVQIQCQENNGQPSRLDGDNKIEPESCIRVQGSIDQEKAIVQTDAVGIAQEHTAEAAEEQAGEVEDVELQYPPIILQGSSQLGIEEGEDQRGDRTPGGKVQQSIGKQSPELSLQNESSIKPEGTIELSTGIGLDQKIDQNVCQNDPKHQIGDALLPVTEEKLVELKAGFTQDAHSFQFILILPDLVVKVYGFEDNSQKFS